MSIINSVLIYGCGEGTVGATLAMALAGKAVHVFACWPSIIEMPQLDDINNITTIRLDPASPPTLQAAQEFITTRLNGGKLNMIINAGFVGHEAVRDCDGARRAAFWGSHLSNLKNMSLDFRPLLEASQGTIINLTSHELLIHETILSMFPYSFVYFSIR